MKTTITFLWAVLFTASARRPLPPVNHFSSETSSGIDSYGVQYNNNESREINAINSIFDAIQGLSNTKEVATTKLLEKLREVFIASASEKDLSREERNQKYTPIVFNVLRKYTRTIKNQRERKTLLGIIEIAKVVAKHQNQSLIPSKDNFLAFIEYLFDLVNEPFPGASAGVHVDVEKQEEEKRKFLAVLDSALDLVNL